MVMHVVEDLPEGRGPVVAICGAEVEGIYVRLERASRRSAELLCRRCSTRIPWRAGAAWRSATTDLTPVLAVMWHCGPGSWFATAWLGSGFSMSATGTSAVDAFSKAAVKVLQDAKVGIDAIQVVEGLHLFEGHSTWGSRNLDQSPN
jgi:ribosomal protein L40E